MATTKDEILKRSKERADKIKILHVDVSDDSSSFAHTLSPLQSWELVSKIAREMYFLSTGKIADCGVDKNIVKIIQNTTKG
ncbi:MAG: hypothetical protein WHU93_02905 [Arcobacteraceae bacterium]|jgi:GTP cyclohydrolase III